MSTSNPGAPQAGDAAPARREADLTGRERMAWNVLASWGGYLAVAVTGFIMPRLTDGHLGQEALGVWDLGWSVVSYFGLAQLGVGGSVNRYVAKYRGAHDVEGLRRLASSATCINVGSGLLALLATAVVIVLAPWLIGDRLGEQIEMARWVIALLGATVAVEMSFAVFPGVIAGCHRWDLHNAMNVGFEVSTAAAMVVTLYAGGGLRALALVALCGELATEMARIVVAYRVCPELRVGLRYVSLAEGKDVLMFGTKYSLGGLSNLLLVQANNLIIASYLGPAALAAFARPMSLLRIVEAFTNRFAFVLTPMASSLQGGGRRAEVPALLVQSARFGVALAMPMLLGLAILGQPVLLVWMGPRYAVGGVIAVLALSYVLQLAQRPAVSILIGLNLHGPLAVASLVTAVLGGGLGVLNAWVLHWGLIGAALAIAIPVLLVGIFIGYYVCRRIDISPTRYVREVFLRPVACVVPFALVLGAARVWLGHRPALAVAVGCVGGALVIGPLYWVYLLPISMRERALRVAGQVFGSIGLFRSKVNA